LVKIFVKLAPIPHFVAKSSSHFNSNLRKGPTGLLHLPSIPQPLFIAPKLRLGAQIGKEYKIGGRKEGSKLHCSRIHPPWALVITGKEEAS